MDISRRGHSIDMGSQDQHEEANIRRGVSRSESICSINRKSLLRKKIIELKELEGGIKQGCRVICFPDSPEEGIVKWLGKINQIIYIGIEFDNPIGINFPETKGASPFPCRLNHGRLVLRNDLLLSSDFGSNPPTPKNLKDVSESQNIPEFPEIGNFQVSIPMALITEEFSTKLEEFYDFCSKAEDSFDQIGVQIDSSCSDRVPSDPIAISLSLERHKSFLSEVEDRYSLIDLGQKKSEELFMYADILLPSEERRINRSLEELTNTHNNMETKLKIRIRSLEASLDACQTIKDLLNEKLDWLNGIRAQLRQMDKNLIKTETELASRKYLTDSLLHSFSSSESEEILEILEKIAELHSICESEPVQLEELDTKFDTQLMDIMGMRNQLLEVLQTKSIQLKEAHQLFHKFSSAISSFDLWYEDYMQKVCGAQLQDDLDESENQDEGYRSVNFDLVQEREDKRGEFLDILESAKRLRVSIFDRSVLDDRIHGLQTKWRALMDRCYRDKFRRSM